MATKAAYDVFLSHVAVDTAVVRELARRLENAGLKTFVPVRDIMVGRPWELGIEKGLEQSRTLAILIGPSPLKPDEARELKTLLWKAEENGLRVISVALPGAASVPWAQELWLLARSGWVDLSDGFNDSAILYLKNRLPESAERRPKFKLPRFSFKPRFRDVWLATAAPPSVAPNSKFVARFSAYTQEYRSQITQVFAVEAPESKMHLDLHACQWEPGTKVTVTLSAYGFHIDESPQTFVWNGKWVVLRFDVSAPGSIDEGRLILKFDVSIEGLTIARLRPELKIAHKTAEERELAKTKAPDKAFASYASPDRGEVLGRIRSLQIYANIEVFLDCLSIHPGDRWKERIKIEIEQRDIFWLFWSRNALRSPWVEWEWRTALVVKDIDYIQPHPLEGPDIAPPPPELAALQFGTLYESFLSQIKSSWWNRRFAQCRRAVRCAVGSFRLIF